MIAMQYSFVLPADYDMAVIRERIATKGALLDHLSGLAFKAYLYAERGAPSAQPKQSTPSTPSTPPENLYAPFYLWRDVEAMHDFLNGPGFAGVAQAFGWPSVRTWTPWYASVGDDVRRARHASSSVVAIAPHSDLAALRQREQDEAKKMLERGALAVVVGFEPVAWSVTRLCLWRDAPPAAEGQQCYQVGHVSAPASKENDETRT